MHDLVLELRNTFWSSLEVHGDSIALIEGRKSLSYSELAEKADQWASAARRFLPANVDKPLVSLEMSNSISAVSAYLGCLRAGWPVIVLAEGQTGEAQSIVDLYQPNLIVETAGRKVTPRSGSGLACRFLPDLALLLSTSGTTGARKLVRLSGQNIQANAESIADYLAIETADTAITTLPLQYSYGLSVLHSYLQAGASIVLSDISVVQPEFWDLARGKDVTSLALVPTQFELLAKGGFRKDWLPSLRYMTQAGGRLDPVLATRFAQDSLDNRWQFFIMYGQTEAGPRISYLPSADALDYGNSIGRAIPGGNLRIEDADGQAIDEPGIPGELVYEGPNVMLGYAMTRDDLSAEPGDPVLRTGDIAERLENGYFRIVGRASRFIKPFGLRVSLDEVEDFIRGNGDPVTLSGNDQGVVIFAHDKDFRQAWCREALQKQVAAKFKLPESCVFVSYLETAPLLPSGKVNHRELLDRAALIIDEGVNLQSDASLVPHLERILRRDNIDTSKSFQELGGDSLAYVETELVLTKFFGSAPTGWEIRPLKQLLDTGERSEAGGSGSRMQIGSDLIIRVIAIITVVLLHSTHLLIASGGVFMLMTLVGYSLARFQFHTLTEGRVFQSARTMLTPILTAYYLITIPLALHFPVGWRWYALIMNFNLMHHEIAQPHFFVPYWFVATYAQIVLLLCIPFLIPPLRRTIAQHSLLIGVVGVVALCSAIIFSPVSELFYGAKIRHPLSAMELAMLGWCMAHAGSARGKLLVSLLLLASYGLVWSDADIMVSLFLTIVPMAILWCPRLSVPKRLGRGVLSFGSITLYIYVSHVPVLYFTSHFIANNYVCFAVTFALSVVLAIAIKTGIGWVTSRLSGNGPAASAYSEQYA